MTQKMNVDELKDVIGLALEMVEASSVILADGQLSFSDIGAVWGVVEKIGPAVAGSSNVPAELKDLSKEECDELIQFVMEELADVDSPKSKEIVEKVLRAAKAVYEVYLALEVD